VRLTCFDKRVCIVERHEQFGGLNSFYRLDGRQFDVGLHALTNYVPPGVRSAPLPKLLRQLRIPRDEWDLHEQTWSEVRFPHHRLRFSNDVSLLVSQVAEVFPRQADGFVRLVEFARGYDDVSLHAPWRSTRQALAAFLSDPTLIDMILCPVMYYGSAEEHDLDLTHFVTMFKSLFLQGLARPRGGVRTIISSLVRRFRAQGGQFRMKCGVTRLVVDDGRVRAVALETGEVLTAPIVFSSAGYHETMALCPAGEPRASARAEPPARCASEPRASARAEPPVRTETPSAVEASTALSAGTPGQRQGSDAPPDVPGVLSFVESICVLNCLPKTLGHESTITFFNHADTFEYACPAEPVDVRSGVICCPSNFERHDDVAEGVIRFTSLARADAWESFPEEEYRRQKQVWHERVVEQALRYLPDFRPHVVYTDTFTPRTIRRYTSHLGGAVYGAPRKRRDGRTPIENLFICGTDQGFLGIIGACLSGITVANLYGLE